MKNERKLAAVVGESQKDYLRKSQSTNTVIPIIRCDYIIQVLEEIERRLTVKLSLEFSRPASQFLGALSKLGDFVLNWQAREQFGIVPETSQNSNRENQEQNGDRSQNDPRHEADTFVNRFLNLWFWTRMSYLAGFILRWWVKWFFMDMNQFVIPACGQDVWK